MPVKWGSDLERFLAKTERDPETGCLVWTAATTDRGYGVFETRDRKTWRAHRWIFREMYGWLPEVVMHTCDNPPCVDWINHLAPGTHASNTADMIRKGRAPNRKGERNGNSKLSDAEAAEVREEYVKGILTQPMLGEVYGVSFQAVSKIVNKDRRWS
jgi:hypothetical protein